MRRDGLVIPVRPGLYQLAGSAAPDVGQQHRALTLKALEQLSGSYVVAHESAAAFHGLWTPRPLRIDTSPVRLFAVDSRNACKRNGLHVTVSPLGPGDVTLFGTIPVTSLQRTAVDLARGMSLARALIPLDSALRLGATPEALLETARGMRRWPGTRLLRQCIPLARSASESALESAARGALLLTGVPEPLLQEQLFGASGSRYRVDMYWPNFQLVLEPDGLAKYGTEVAAQRRAFEQEKQREDDLRAAGYRVLRLTWSTLDAVVAQVARIASTSGH